MNRFNRSMPSWLIVGIFIFANVSFVGADDTAAPFAGWTQSAPRDELRPEFAIEAQGGRDQAGSLVIRADAREGLDGAWRKVFPVRGGTHYRFAASYRAEQVTSPRRSVVAQLQWRDDAGKIVPLDEPSGGSYLRGSLARAETEFPATHTPSSAMAQEWRIPAGDELRR